MKIEGRDIARRFTFAYFIHHISIANRPIVIHRNAENVVARQSGHLDVEACHFVIYFLAAFVVVESGLPGTHRVDKRAVLGKNFHFRVHQLLMRLGLIDHAGELDSAWLISPVILDEYLFIPYLCLDGKSRTEPLDGFRHGEPIEADMDGKALEVVGDEVNGVFRLHVAQGGKSCCQRHASESQVACREAEADTHIYNNV